MANQRAIPNPTIVLIRLIIFVRFSSPLDLDQETPGLRIHFGLTSWE